MKAALVLAMLILADVAAACDGLQVTKAWIREAPPGAAVMAGYAELKNAGRQSITLVGARSPDFGSVEVHRMEMEQGQMRMRAEPRLLLEPDATVRMEPGGLHLMLSAPRRPLKAGDHAALKLDCESKSLVIDFPVRAEP